ncbi:hypothetical protein GSU68_04745 [Rathayibacter sp. VKM Ac-2759]|uniref:hypothetical protein n=1 Tax=Rathayibacter sp. VKM Ac-2759 TaxID=2609252 RepID=UPI00131775AF|nr:hypothetical protein [Rathayibacter sp. VKM Ac-2759]QHC65957.1 hypothetical protein GSU68_04745 [Rathayibacter sp. VKM Ac-2759]
MVRPGILLAFVVVVALVGAAGFGLGASMRTAAAVDEAAAEEPPAVEAAVERRSISPPRTIQGVVDAGDTETVGFTGISDPAVLPYVTEVGAGAGEALANGGLLLAVAGRPRIALRVSAPLYRDLRVGDVGADVESFEAALQAAVGGDFDVDETMTARTAAAAEELWASLGYDLPTRTAAASAETTTPSSRAAPEPFVDVREIVQLASDTVTVASVLAVGDSATADAPLATLQTSPRRIVARATVLDAEVFPAGTPLLLRADGRPEQTGQVGRLGDFADSDGTAGSAAGRDVHVDLPAEWSDLPETSTVTMTTVAAGEPVLAVPLSAVHDASTSPFVVVAHSTRFARGDEVPVTVLGSGDGWVRIDEASGLVDGDTIVLSP